ncbi:MAG: hypothetical protein AAGK97_15050, partial [Bacteroidota bacterium]
GIAALLSSLLLFYIWNKRPNHTAFAKKIESSIKSQELDFEKLIKDKRLLNIQGIQDSLLHMPEYQMWMDSIFDKPYHIQIKDEGNLLFWSFLGSRKQNLKNHDILHLNHGIYWYVKAQLNDQQFAEAYIPIKKTNTSKEAYTSQLKILDKESAQGKLISNINNKAICKIATDQHISSIQYFIVSSLFLLSLILFLFAIYKIANQLRSREGILLGTSFILLSVFAMRYILILTEANNYLKGFDVFKKPIYSALNSSSLGDLLINISLLIYLALFVHKSIRNFDFAGIRVFQRYLLGALNYFSILLGLLMVAGLIKNLVVASGINFDFENVFHLNKFSFISLLAIIALILAFFMIAHGITLTIKKLRLPTNMRILTMFLAMLFSVPFFFIMKLDIPFLPYYSGMIIFTLLMDLMSDNQKPNVTWFFVW